MLKISSKVKQDLFLYIMIISLFYIFYKIGIIKGYSIYLLMLLLFFFIKDILKYFVDFNFVVVEKISYLKLLKDKSITNTSLFLILNRNIIFPLLLIWYMIFLLIKQTHLWWLDKYINISELWQNVLLWIVIVSGILTVFKEDIDKKYLEKKEVFPWFSILLTILLSVLWTYIIFNQVIKLWNLAYVISLISGMLIFLVWISILEDDENDVLDN